MPPFPGDDHATVAETLRVPEGRRKDIWQRSERRSTMFIASVDIKTAINVGKVSKHIAKMWVDKTPMDGIQQLQYGKWKGLKRSATFENVKSKLRLTKLIRAAWMTMKMHRRDSTECRFEKNLNILGYIFNLSGSNTRKCGRTDAYSSQRMMERRKHLRKQRCAVEDKMRTDGGTSPQRVQLRNRKLVGRGVEQAMDKS